MRKLLRLSRLGVFAAIALGLFAIGSPALAGPNAGGTLIVHANPAIIFCDDVTDYCGQDALISCPAAITQVDGTRLYAYFVIASFCPANAPRLSGITFGVNHDVALVSSGSCGDFELAGDGWPASGTGTAITWNAAQTSLLVGAYWFAGYNYYSPTPAHFAVTPHPTQGGYFADDSVPALLDPIAGYGSLGFDQPGFAPCPNCAQPQGACCLPNCGPCIVTSHDDCAAQNGLYLGDGTDCEPNECDCPPQVGACCIGCECLILTEQECLASGGVFFGVSTDCSQPICGEGPPIACCLPDGTCLITTPCGCIQIGGVWDGQTTSCEPNPCGPVATEKSTWGGVKRQYR